MAIIEQLLVELVLAIFRLCSKVISSEIVERRSLKREVLFLQKHYSVLNVV